MATTLKVEPGMSTPCQNPRVANRQVASSDWKASISAGLGRSDWARMGKATRSRRTATAAVMARQLVEEGEHCHPAAVIERGQLVVDGRLRLRAPTVGERPSHVEHSVGRIVEGAAHIELVGPFGGEAESVR